MNARPSIATDPIRHLCGGMDVSALARQLDAHPEAWDQNTMRTAAYADSPHRQVSDIWVRYNALENLRDGPEVFNGPHVSTWYPVVRDIPAAWSLSRQVMRKVRGKQLGGVLITRIPAGSEVKPHIDHGWHARYYEKFAVQIKGNERQAFCFDGCALRPLPGDLYTFDNSRLHWVTNDSKEERITLIVCVRR